MSLRQLATYNFAYVCTYVYVIVLNGQRSHLIWQHFKGKVPCSVGQGLL